jgi:cytochrome b involved in lipid metabolism
MKRLLISALLLAAAVANAQSASYTLADVAAHASASDCWMVLNSNKVYNLTPFIKMHPGGSVIAASCGKDGTAAFASVPHSSNAVALEATYLIGTLASAPVAIAVKITPPNATVTMGSTVQFTPTVTNSSVGVAWTVTPSSLGTISASGMFTAVAAGQGTVTAASMQDSTKSASALITVNSSNPVSAHTITVAVSPSAMSVNAGSRARFKAMLANSTQGVNWTVTGAIGTIDKNGVLSAALTPGTGTVTATSVEDPTKSASAQVTLTALSCRPERSDQNARAETAD